MATIQTDVEEYYTKFFTENEAWSTPYPNPDEGLRWGKICEFLSRIPELQTDDKKRQGLRILDVGCGRGWLTNLASVFGSCDGVEPVAGSVEAARGHFPRLNFTVGSAADVARSADFMPYDVVVTSEVIEHVIEKDGFIAELKRCLVPGGHVVLTTPRGEEFQKFLRIAAREDMQPVEAWVTEEELRALFVRQGFKPVKHDRLYVDIPYMSRLHRFCEHYGGSRKLDVLHLKSVMKSLQYVTGIYQVWWFQVVA